MHCGEFEVLALDYMDDRLTTDVKAAADTHLATCTGCRHEIETLRPLWRGLRTDTLDIPVDRMRFRLASATSNDTARRSVSWIAAAVLVVAVGAGAWYLRSHVRDHGAPPLVATNSLSAQLRIGAVAECAARPATRCTTNLLGVIARDNNANVRIAAVDALARGNLDAETVNSLAVSLRSESSPVVQAVIVDAIRGSHEAPSRRVLRQVAQTASYDPVIRELAQFALAEDE